MSVIMRDRCLARYFQSYRTILDVMFNSDYVNYCLSPNKVDMTETEFCSKKNAFIQNHLLGMGMNASLINALCHYVLWVHECGTVDEYDGKLKEVADSMKIGHIVFVSGFDDTKQAVWQERLDDHLHYELVLVDNANLPFDSLAPLSNEKEESYGSTPPPFSINL